jgi:acetyl esterase/lipase
MKNYLPLVEVLILFASINVYAQTEKVYLWPEEVPGEMEPKHDAVQTPDTSGGVIRLTDVTNPVLSIFEPEESNKNGAGIIIAPGGGYQILAIDKEGYEIAEWLNKLGYTAFVLQYRVPQKQEQALIDMQRAVRFVRSKADEYELDTSKIGVLGFSAGGSLSARISTRFDEVLYEPIDEMDVESARPDFAVLIYPAYLDLGEDGTVTPELNLEAEVPPIFFFATKDDPYTGSSHVFSQALYKKGLDYELHIYPQGGHGYGMRKGNPAAEIWPELAADWLNRVVFER